MLQLTSTQISTYVGLYFWPFVRIAAMLMVMPIIGTRLVAMRVRLLLALAMSLLVAPLLPPMPLVDAISVQLLILLVEQMIIGAGMGFCVLVLFQTFVVLGQLASMQMGLAMASMVDPSNGISVPILGQFYLLLTTLMFLSMNGHLVMFEIMIESFFTLPVGGGTLPGSELWRIVMSAGWMFSAAVLAAIPMITALLISNLAFGVMTRSAPQLNVFALGFPIGMLFGLFVVWISSQGLIPHYEELTRQVLMQLRQLVGAT